jgi:hypothetical protein
MPSPTSIKLLYRDALNGYRFNGYLDEENVFVGEFVFPDFETGINLTLLLRKGAFQRVTDLVSQPVEDSPDWVYQCVLRHLEEAVHIKVGLNSERLVTELGAILLPLHQLALLQIAQLT